MPAAPRLAPRFGLRAKVLVVALVLLAIPLAGWSYLKEVERVLRAGQEQAVAATSRAVATALHDRPKLLDLRARTDAVPDPAAPPLPGGARRVAPDPRAATEEIELIIQGLGRSSGRIWVVDRKLNLLAIAGSLKRAETPERAQSAWERFVTAPLRPFLERVLARPTEDFDDALPEAAIAGGRDVASALDGVPASRWRHTPDGRAAIVSAAHPIWHGEEVVGAVVVEETANAIQSLSSDALERLVTVTLVAFLIGGLTLLLFASRLSERLRRLRDEAEAAIDSQGRIRRLITGTGARDEIGDLSRSFSTALERIAQYNAHLEALAGRLSHELRTPIAVVRSSLDNLRMQDPTPEARVYLERANDGLARLTTLITRMGEATRLEQTVREAERERFDARAVTAGCVAGYASAYPTHRFVLDAPSEPVWIDGAPDLFAQMLDKLAANAVDFSPREAPIRVALARRGGEAALTMTNHGPPLPAEIAGRLFETMVSARKDAGPEPHLGLGLYIVRLIAEFHRGHARAANLPDGSGVAFTVTLPLAAAP
ncbi:MAG: ATP-binding protein [Burkholderiales bacterium]|nr:ATP-binding protein [Burkholderiales bacterium]